MRSKSFNKPLQVAASVRLLELSARVGGLPRVMEHCNVVPALHVAAHRVLQRAWPNMHLADQFSRQIC